MSMSDNENFFDKFGLEITSGEVEVGSTYPIYGMITKIINEDITTGVVVEINFNIEASLSIKEQDKIELIKARSFEPGIFVCTVVSKEPNVKVDCSTVVFGKKQTPEQ